MYYAHVGSSTDNAFSTINGSPVRSFLAFDSKGERREFQADHYRLSGGERNAIFCHRKFVEKYMGRDFRVLGAGIIVSRAESEMYDPDQRSPR